MLLQALVSQLEQRFQHEKRARVCLWFDEKGEFRRLLPALRRSVEEAENPPFVLLEYEAANYRGQVWLKSQVHRRTAGVSPGGQERVRFVLYIPMTEDRLDSPSDDGEGQLDLLEEYRVTGVLFRIGGKRPTLFSFLRQAGVKLPDSPAEQRRLWDGGADSLLAMYAAKFAGRPADWWSTQLTAEVAQARLVGDLVQTIFDISLNPDAAWSALVERGLDREFLEMVSERYGFSRDGLSPSAWIREFVAMTALTETYVGYNEPADFPLADRLAPVALRTYHLDLVRRWLRDAEYRDAWDNLVEELESDIDLASWAAGRSGKSFSLPHLVWERWREIYARFETAAAKGSTTAEFFKEHATLLAEQSEFLKATHRELGSWRLLRELGVLLDACQKAEASVDTATTVERLAWVYVENAARIDGTHLKMRHDAEEAGLAAVASVADRAYASFANALNEAFFKQAVSRGSVEIPGLDGVTAHVSQAIWNAKARRAVVIVDALRYDCALAIRELLHGQTVDVQPMQAVLPTITAVGMTALLPAPLSDVALEVKGNALHPKVAGTDMSVRENRLGFLRAYGADCRDIADVEAAAQAPDDLGELLVVSGHDEVDHIGHGQGDNLVRHIHLEVARLARLIRKLHRWGYPRVHIVTDHGFILLDDRMLPPEVPCDKQWCVVRKERFALVPAKADVPLARFPFPWDSSVMVAVPPGLAFFKAEKSFSHGGASLQEIVIPHLVSRSQVASEKRVAVEVVLQASELQRPAVKVTLRASSAGGGKAGGKSLFPDKGRTMVLDVFRCSADCTRESVLAGMVREVRLEAEQEQTLNLFFHTAASFVRGEQLLLDIRDVETTEQFPAGGLTLTVGRDM